jgi:hypothetical protein
MPSSSTETILIVFVAITGVSVLLQAGVLLGIFFTVRKAVADGKEQADEFRSKLTPVLEASKEFLGTANELFGASKGLVDAASPRLKSAATELDAMILEVHAQAQRLQASVDDVALKAARQVDRVDGMATSALNSVEKLVTLLNEAVRVPVRQVNGVIAAAKAVIETLRAPAPPRTRRAPQSSKVAEDKDLFV